MPYPEEYPCGYEWGMYPASDCQEFPSLSIAGEKKDASVVVRVRGKRAFRLYLRGWAIWWPGAQLVQEKWFVDEYRVSGEMQVFLLAIEAAGCRVEQRMASYMKGR